jgi:outer membrane biosynthesis protein TonB
MPDRSKNRKKELEDFLRYSQDQMSEEERNAFERSLLLDPFDAEALEGLSSITPEEATADLARLQDKVRRRTTKRIETSRTTRTMWYRVAAAVAVLLVVTSVLFTLFNDRMGQLERKVAESPETEKETAAPESSTEKSKEEPSDAIIPVQNRVMVEEAEVPEKKETIQLESDAVESETEIITALEAEIVSKEIKGEELAREEIADIRIEEVEEFETDIRAAEQVVAEQAYADEVAAPAMAMDRPAAAKSRKLDKGEQLQMAGAVAAEQRIISGVVISGEDEQPISGVIVAVKGSSTGTVTDLEGKFNISLENDSQNTLIARFIGMEQKEISIQDQEEIMITLEPDAISLEQVVVIATAPKTVSQPTGYTVALAEPDAEKGKSEYHSAAPVGGKKIFNEYIKSNIRFPEDGGALTKGVVVLNFVVGYDGRPAQFSVLKSPGKAFSDEAIRLLLEGPDWQPAEVGGVKIEEGTRIRIVFKKD